MKPKLLEVVTLSEWGGAQHVVFQLARHLAHEVEVTVACAPGGALVDRLRAEGVRVVCLPALVRPPHPWQDLRALWRLYRLMKEERFDLVHAHSTKAGLLGRLAARWANVPAVFTAHGWAFAAGRAAWKRRALARVERLAAHCCDKIICVSEHDRQLALQWRVAPRGKLVTIHNGVDPRPFSGRKAALLAPPQPALVFLGRLSAQKDPLTLLRAFRQLSQGKLLMVGEGPLRLQVERWVESFHLAARVKLLGAQREVAPILASADIFVLSSRWEGLPLAIIEAMLAGLPVVATRVGGVPELVEDAKTGFLVPPGDPQALADALQALLESKGLREEMGKAGREKALQELTPERMLRETERVYEEVMRGSARALG